MEVDKLRTYALLGESNEAKEDAEKKAMQFQKLRDRWNEAEEEENSLGR